MSTEQMSPTRASAPDDLDEMMAPYFDERDDAGTPREERLADALGWFSVALGLTEMLAHRPLARWMGVRDRPALFRMLGARELAAGIGILNGDRPAGWMWSRVAGDAVDLALLGAAMGAPHANRRRIAAATGLIAGITALDYWCGDRLSRSAGAVRRDGVDDQGAMHVRRSITINRSPEDLYRFWRDFQNLPQVMKHLESVQVLDSHRSHWVAKGPAGAKVEWDAEVIDDRPNDTISWRSLDGSTIDHSGAVHFRRAPNNEGTVVSIEMQYRVPGGRAGRTLAQLFGAAPEQRIKEDLRPFKQLMETGEIATTRGQSSGRARALRGAR